MNYDALEPGIEMDALVARHIFGWTEEKTVENRWFDPFVKLWRPMPRNNPATPAWSRAPANALEVVDKMTYHGLGVSIHHTAYQFYAIYVENGNRETKGASSGDFAAAICRAALQAVAS